MAETARLEERKGELKRVLREAADILYEEYQNRAKTHPGSKRDDSLTIAAYKLGLDDNYVWNLLKLSEYADFNKFAEDLELKSEWHQLAQS